MRTLSRELPSAVLDAGARFTEATFECWRAWPADTIARSLRLDPVAELPSDFCSPGEVLTVGEVSIVDVRYRPAMVSWRQTRWMTAGCG